MPSPAAGAKVRTIIFDIGRVLIRVDVSRAMAGLSQSIPLSPEEIWTALQKDPHWMDWQEGRISPRDWHAHLVKRLGGSLSFDEFVVAWNRALDPEPLQSDEFLGQLAKRYKLALLSNTDPIHMDHEEARFPFFRFFPVRIYSYRMGASKPNPLIYRAALEAAKCRAPEAVYVDDLAEYVDAARALGLRGIVYLSPEQLRTDLTKCGVTLD
jgi:glucose-1-phosphatase